MYICNCSTLDKLINKLEIIITDCFDSCILSAPVSI